ncbi:MAG: YihY/virulence factor BrkB family protein [Actinomycetota bacterium]
MGKNITVSRLIKPFVWLLVLRSVVKGRLLDREGGHAISRAPETSDRGTPDSPLDLERGDWKATAKRAVREIKEDRIALAAAGMAYYLFLAIFPALIAFVGILGLAEIDTQPIIDSVRETLPGNSGGVLVDAISGANRASEEASLIATLVGIAAALWSASSGFAALQIGLNVAYDVDDDRKFVGKRAMGIVLLVATLLLGGVPSPFFGFGDGLLFDVLGWILTVAAVSLLFSIYYYLGPNRTRQQWQWVSAGGVFGAVLWILVSLGLGWYVSGFGDYSKTYGPFAGVIVLILWLYVSSLVILIGGELNSELERQARRTARR